MRDPKEVADEIISGWGLEEPKHLTATEVSRRDDLVDALVYGKSISKSSLIDKWYLDQFNKELMEKAWSSCPYGVRLSGKSQTLHWSSNPATNDIDIKWSTCNKEYLHREEWSEP